MMGFGFDSSGYRSRCQHGISWAVCGPTHLELQPGVSLIRLVVCALAGRGGGALVVGLFLWGGRLTAGMLGGHGEGGAGVEAWKWRWIEESGVV
jgi:hypothetical protein